MLDQVRSAVSALEAAARDLEPRCLDSGGAAELLDAAAKGKKVCAAIETLAAGRVAETGAWKGGGRYRTAAHYVADATGETVGAATRTLETARRVEELPATEAAFRAGALSEVQAAEITGAASADPEAEAPLLEAAVSSTVKGLRDRCREVRAGAQVDDEAWARRLHTTRRASEWTDPEGAYNMNARMSSEAGARFSAAWRAETDRIFREARREGRREPRQAYMADALVALATDGPCKPVEVKGIFDAAAIRRGYAEPGERCELDGVGPVPVTTARALLDDASITLMLKDGEQITTVSSPKRTIPAKVRRVLEASFPVCGVKGCDAGRGLQIDHVIDLAKGGETCLQNLWRICPHHHFLKTYCGWVVVGQLGDWNLVPPPDGKDPPST